MNNETKHNIICQVIKVQAAVRQLTQLVDDIGAGDHSSFQKSCLRTGVTLLKQGSALFMEAVGAEEDD